MFKAFGPYTVSSEARAAAPKWAKIKRSKPRSRRFFALIAIKAPEALPVHTGNRAFFVKKRGLHPCILILFPRQPSKEPIFFGVLQVRFGFWFIRTWRF